MNKKWIMIVLMAFLLSGCGTKQVGSDANIREVSSKAVPMDCWKITRWCEADGDFKEYTEIEISIDDLRPLQNLKYLDFSMTSIGDTCTSEEIIEAFPKLEALYFLVWD